MDDKSMMALGLRVSRECLSNDEAGVVRGLRSNMGMSALRRIRSSSGATGVAEGYSSSCVGCENRWNQEEGIRSALLSSVDVEPSLG